jgi:hypothetical protein
VDDEDDEEEDDDDDDDDAADGVVDTEQLTAAPASGASTPPLFYSSTSKGYHQITLGAFLRRSEVLPLFPLKSAFERNDFIEKGLHPRAPAP